MCLLCSLVPFILFQISNEVINLINLSSTNNHFLTTLCSHWDFSTLPCLLHDLDSHQSPSSLSSAIACLNIFKSSPQLHCIVECTFHTQDDILLVYDLGVSADLSPFKSDLFDYVKCSIPVHDISKVNGVIGIGSTIHKFIDTK